MPKHKQLSDLESRSLLVTEHLKCAISEQNDIRAALVIASCFDGDCQADILLQQLDAMQEQVKTRVTSSEAKTAFRQMLDCFYRDLAFSCDADSPHLWRHSLLNHVMDYRIGMPVSLAIVFTYLAEKVGIQSKKIALPGHFLLACSVDNEQLYLNPQDGSVLTEAALIRYCHEFDEDMDEKACLQNRASCLDTVTRLLQNLRNTCMREGRLQDSLLASQLLVNLHPDDPYEYRSRAIVFDRLKLPQHALSDYQHFIRECPQDPSSHLLKLQLRQRHRQHRTVLH